MNTKKSWRTTAVGILTAVALISTQIVAILDNDPKTVFSIEAIIAALGAAGLGWLARDKGVSSEDEGVK